MGIQRRVQEPQRALTHRNPLLVDAVDDPRKDGRRRACASREAELASDIDGDVVTIGCDVRDPAADAVIDASCVSREEGDVGESIDVARVELCEAAVVWVAWVVVGEVSRHGRLLVVRDGVDVAEPAARAIVDAVRISRRVVYRTLGLEDRLSRIHLGRAHVCNIRAIVRPRGVEDVVLGPQAASGAVVSVWLGVVSHARVAGREEERDALQAELEVFVALAFLVGDGHVGFLAAVGDGEDVGGFEDTALEGAIVAVWTCEGVSRGVMDCAFGECEPGSGYVGSQLA